MIVTAARPLAPLAAPAPAPRLARRAGLVLVALLVAFYTLVTAVGMNQRVDKQVAETGHHFAISDLFPRWLGAKAMLAGVSPYSEEFRADLHRQYYGEVKSREWERDTLGSIAEFFYPPYVLIPLLPLLWLPFEAARWLGGAALAAAVSGATLLWLRHAGVRLGRTRTVAVAVLAGVFFPTLDVIMLQQLTGLVYLYLVGAAFLAGQKRYALSGAVLALATIKPQGAAIPVACLLFWALWRRERWTLFAAFGAVMAAQLALAQALVPGWVGAFLAGNERYREFNVISYWLPGAITKNAPLAWVLIVAPLSALIAWVWWKIRHLELRSAAACEAFALALAASVALMPDISSYNKVLLLPGIAACLLRAQTHSPAARLTQRFLVLAVTMPVTIYTLSQVAVLVFGQSVEPAALLAAYGFESHFAMLPVLCLPALVVRAVLAVGATRPAAPAPRTHASPAFA